jgi:NADH-quinone oxidoreductase subunit C
VSSVPAADLADALGAVLPGGVLEAADAADMPCLVVDPGRLDAACRHLKDVAGFQALVDLTAVDFPRRELRFDVVVILRRPADGERVRLVARVGGERPQVPSLAALWPAAVWPEREVYDLFGVEFAGSPDMRRILLPDDWEGHPLRKDYPLHGPRALNPESPYAH